MYNLESLLIVVDSLDDYMMPVQARITLRGRPFNTWGGGYGFFVKKKFVCQVDPKK